MVIDLNFDEKKFYERVTSFKKTRNAIYELKDKDSNFEIDLYGKEVSPAFHSAFILGEAAKTHVEATGSIRGYCGPIMATHLFWDLDVNKEKGQEFDDVCVDVKNLLDRLESSGADLEAVTIWYSGQKGLHIVYQTEDISGIGWSKNLHRIVKKVCSEYADGLDSFDDSVYDRTRIIRVSNSKHDKTGLYKIPFTVQEFYDTDTAVIREMAKEQKEVPEAVVDVDVDYVLQAIAEAEDALDSESGAEERRERKGESYVNNMLSGLEFGFTSGDRNVGLTRIAGMLNRKDFDERFIKAMLMGINSMGDSLPERDVDRIVSSVIKYPSDPQYIEADSGHILTMRDNLMKYREMRKDLQDIVTPYSYMNPILKTFDPSKVLLICARPGVGKAVSNSTLIPTPTGKIKMSEIRVGDTVFGRNGKKTTVTGVFPQGERQLYKITFDNGVSVDADSEHRWLVKKRPDYEEEVMTTKDLIEYCKYKDTCKDKRYPTIPYCEPVDYDSKEVLIDPWLMGALLGDGSLSCGQLGFSNSEDDIIERVSERVLELVHRSGCDYRINDVPLRNSLREYSLFGAKSDTKFIPEDYLTNDVECRLNLLRGLIDTDGSIRLGRGGKPGHLVTYATVSKALCLGVIELVRSLGGRATYSSKQTSYTYKGEKKRGKEAYIVSINMNHGVVPFTSKKHLDRYDPDGRRNNTSIISIEESAIEHATCISVDADDHLFLCGDYCVTHNTLWAMKLANEIVKYTGETALMISLEMDGASVGFRAAQCVKSLQDGELDNDQVTHQVCENDDFVDEVAEEWSRFLTVDKTLRTVEQIEQYYAEANELSQKMFGARTGLVVLDYLQLMDTGQRSEFDRIVRDLKGISKRLGCRFIALTQLSRLAGDGTVKPALHHLRDSGAIEEVGNIIMGLWNDTVDDNRIHAEILKWREGKKGTNFDLIQRGMAYKCVPFQELEPNKPKEWGR